MNPPLIAPTAVGKNRYAEIGRIRFRYALFEPTVAGTEGAAWAGRTDVARDVVLLHGFGGSLFSWRDLAEPLASDHRVLVFDRPGFGLTSRPLREEWMGDEDDPYTLEAAAAQTIGLMDHVGMRKAGLIAHSAGSAVAVAAAARYPERVTALVLEDPAVVCTRMAPNWLGPVLRSGPARRVGPKLTEWASAHTDERSLKRALHNPDLVTPEVMAGYRERWAMSAGPQRSGSTRPPREPSRLATFWPRLMSRCWSSPVMKMRSSPTAAASMSRGRCVARR